MASRKKQTAPAPAPAPEPTPEPPAGNPALRPQLETVVELLAGLAETVALALITPVDVVGYGIVGAADLRRVEFARARAVLALHKAADAVDDLVWWLTPASDDLFDFGDEIAVPEPVADAAAA